MDVRIQEIPFSVRCVASGRGTKEPMTGDNVTREPLLGNLQRCNGRRKREKRESEEKGEESQTGPEWSKTTEQS